ncbi:exopolysaccharide biosynthesis polyprenyl glycosylphosphotransferase [Cyanobium sp. Morenito 9A2]|uniref:exopolysaccharide biosynthesis polyprenyl glycosylphosphotransferase n=1 Tax=Cyanobium sp. Morenito 9A2 TaxID=2823718 RepID=UPI0020CE14D5|nr:exopolysaccharide biosynthesis polyprenyl glycosylphosphotransferase [Cyanobium sp. Morenito 9A2]MCP9849573.1 exopolysaccharide biosynthesis polyprenyl glycosylphosphotransferase [Cyanobium sp. Morenito 9A2]
MWWRTPWLRQRWLLLGLTLLDAALLLGFYNLLFWHRFGRWAGFTPSVWALVMLWVGASYLLGRYSKPEQGQRDSQRWRLMATVLVALLVLASVVVILSWGLKIDDPRTFRSFILPLLAATTGVSALAQLWASRRQRRRHQWLLVGDGDEIRILQQELLHDLEAQGLELFYCDGASLHLQHQRIEAGLDGIAVSEAAPLDDGLLQELLAIRGKGTTVCSLVVWAEQHLQRVPPELFSSRWLVQAEGFELQPGRWGWRLKRLGDLAVASLLLVLSAPLLTLAAVAIKISDGGRVLYSQRRTGMYGEPLEIWKLRSMEVRAETQGAQWAQRNDPRITRIGAWLRKLRLDELPQLVSVLKGDMSLIGPRPERPELEGELEEAIPHYRVRHWVRPGLSGWAQVCYPYGASIEDSRMKLSYDLYYLRNANLMLDVLILIKTLRLVALGQGAVPRDLPQRN